MNYESVTAVEQRDLQFKEFEVRVRGWPVEREFPADVTSVVNSSGVVHRAKFNLIKAGIIKN